VVLATPAGAPRGQPAQAQLALARADRLQRAAASGGQEKEQAPVRGAEAGHQRRDIFEIRLGGGRDQRVDLQGDPGGDNSLGGGQGPAEAAEHSAQAVVVCRNGTVEAERHRHPGRLEVSDVFAGEGRGGARRHADGQTQLCSVPDEVHEVGAFGSPPVKIT
jgi:hypothetical protein